MDEQQTSNQDQKKRRFPNIWWLILLALLLWNVWLIWPKGQAVADIPYTTFVKQVEADNVQQVKIQGDTITGQLDQPILWPQPTPAASSAAASSAVASSATATPAAATPAAGQPATGVAASANPAASPPAATVAVTSGATPAATAASTGITGGIAALAGGSASGTPQPYTLFRSTFPSSVGDPKLMSLLEQHGVTVSATSPPTPWFAILLTDGLPLLLLILFLGYIGTRAARDQSGVFNFGRSRPRTRDKGDHPDVTFEDVAGADEAKADLQEIISFLRNPQQYHQLGARIPRGVLLVGPPGTGKTLMARAVAGEANVPFFNLSASEFVEMFVGVGASRVRDLFQQAKAAGSAIIFIDELDAVGRRRGAGLGMVNDEREQTLNQLLVEMDGFDERNEVILLAATNRPDVLDPALLRPGRFDRQVVVSLPDSRGREGILRIHTRGLRLASDVDLELMARSTTGFSGADLANLCNEAALIAARNKRNEVTMADFGEALDRVLLGAARTLLLNDRERRVVAYHEAGHALVAWVLPEADPVHKVTIIPRGRALGVTEQVPGDDQYNYSHSYLLARLTVMLGGRTAEEIAIGDITTGAENDLVEATRLARRMITRWGMSDLGLAAFDVDDEHPFLGYELAQGQAYSEATAAQVDRAVEALLENRHQVAHQLLSDNRDKLDQLVQALLASETVDQPGLIKILGPRSDPAAESSPSPNGALAKPG